MHSNTARTQRFTVQPVSVMQAEGLETIFECLYPGALSHSWGINGMYPADDAFPPDVTRTLPSGDTPATLAIPATGQYNNTVVQCRAVLIVERNAQIVPTCDVLLLVQGIRSNLSFLMHWLFSIEYLACYALIAENTALLHFRSTGFCYWTETGHDDLYFSDSHLGCPLLSRPHHS